MIFSKHKGSVIECKQALMILLHLLNFVFRYNLARGPDDIFQAQGQCYRVQTGVNDFITPTKFCL